MRKIRSYGEWIDITQRGTSGDQVGDILASWQADAYKMLENINALEAELVQWQRGEIFSVHAAELYEKQQHEIIRLQEIIERYEKEVGGE